MSGMEAISSAEQAHGARRVNSRTTTAAAPESQQRASDGEASLADQLKAHAATESDVRLDKITELQAKIASGNYRIAAGDVAGKLLESLLNGR